MLGSEEASVLSGPGERTFHEEGRQIDARRNAVVSRPQIVQGRRIARPIVPRSYFIEESPWLRIARQNVMRGHEMVVLTMRQRTNNGVFIGASGQARQMLTNQQSRRFGGCSFELAAYFRRRFRFGIECIDVAGRAREKDEDDGLALARRLHRFGCGLGLLRQQRWQANAQKASVADLQQFTAVDADGVAM